MLLALKFGYRHIDCARFYQNEVEVGQGIARALQEGIVKREEIFVTSKIWNTDHAPKHAKASIEQSLKDLQLDYLDLLLVHWPVNWKKVGDEVWEPTNPETGHMLHELDEHVASVKLCWEAMEDAADKGLVRSLGVSNFSTKQLDELFSYARIRPVVHQFEIHPYFQQDELIAYCKSHDLRVEAYCPLGNRPNVPDTPLDDPVIHELGKKYNKTPGQIVLRWGIQHSGVILPRTNNPARLRENFNIFDFELSQEDMAKIKELGKKNIRVRYANKHFNHGSSRWLGFQRYVDEDLTQTFCLFLVSLSALFSW